MATVTTLVGGTLHDGLGNPGQVGNLVIEDDRIAELGNVPARGTRLDVTGLAVRARLYRHT